MSTNPALTPVILQPDDGSLSPATALEILPFGLTLNKHYISDGKTHDIVIGPYHVEDHEKLRRFLNPIVGRYANRVPAGEHKFEKDGIKGAVNAEANEGPEVSLHGGPTGFDRETFKHSQDITTAKLFTPTEIKALQSNTTSASIFTHQSPNEYQGYPGILDLEVIFALSNPSRTWDPKTLERSLGSAIVIYRAVVRSSNKDTPVVTPINITHHWGFNLDASYAKPLSETPDVKQHKLFINSEKIIKSDAKLLPIGELADVKNTKFDFSTNEEQGGELIGSRYGTGYDHFYLFRPSVTRQPTHVPIGPLEDGTQNLVSAIFSKETKPAVKLSSERSGIHLAFHSNQRGVQFYSGIGLDSKVSGRKRIHGGSESSDGYQPGTAAFLEFHAPHSAFTRVENQYREQGGELRGDDTLLTNSEVYNHWVRIDMSQVPREKVEAE